MISLLFAMGSNRVIGKDNDLPWHLPEDLKWFKKVSTGHTIIMGRKTYESIGKPLPNRKNVIVTTDQSYEAEGCVVTHSIEEALQQSGDEKVVIGGTQIFKQVLDQTDRIYMTYIDEEFEGDTFFPELDDSNWILKSKEKGIKDEKNPYDYYFMIYDRKSNA
ncbi:dihydrofolate reductase [Pseudalkalibacillus berkeleyi]|uniref:Dihydrofolate reductase n=1 Tax=Pseudalkalibacillus berkeleyi TaxID=1069813 RepID=A0ABS9GX03_9BACL|nr:dihydrofolate reductase [Pseudalkalibacillus berkeleyi]MCF6137327.1 dihydrofolate reductase [Pseudalkalibacillus berkeleyi]